MKTYQKFCLGKLMSCMRLVDRYDKWKRKMNALIKLKVTHMYTILA